MHKLASRFHRGGIQLTPLVLFLLLIGNIIQLRGCYEPKTSASATPPEAVQSPSFAPTRSKLLLRCKFKATDDPATGIRTGTFWIPAGVSPRELGEELTKVVTDMYKKAYKVPNRLVYRPWILDQLSDAPVLQKRKVTVTLRPDSRYKSCKQQAELLAGYHERFATVQDTALVMLFYRTTRGFPAGRWDAGWWKDQGDFCKGLSCRTAIYKGVVPGGGALRSVMDGVGDDTNDDASDRDYAGATVNIAAGSPIKNRCHR